MDKEEDKFFELNLKGFKKYVKLNIGEDCDYVHVGNVRQYMTFEVNKVNRTVDVYLSCYSYRYGNEEEIKNHYNVFQLIMVFIKKQYPNMVKCKFSDTHKVQESVFKRFMPLYMFHVAKYGQTFYEKYFEAYPSYGGEKDERQKSQAQILTKLPANLIFKDADVDESLLELYESSLHLRDFVNKIVDPALLVPWLEEYMTYSYKGIHGHEWIIDMKQFEAHTKKLKIIEKDDCPDDALMMFGGCYFPGCLGGWGT